MATARSSTILAADQRQWAEHNGSIACQSSVISATSPAGSILTHQHAHRRRRDGRRRRHARQEVEAPGGDGAQGGVRHVASSGWRHGGGPPSAARAGRGAHSLFACVFVPGKQNQGKRARAADLPARPVMGDYVSVESFCVSLVL